VLAAFFVAPARAQSFDYSAWGSVLAHNVTAEGRVDYAALKASPADLSRAVAEIAARSPHSNPADFPTRNDQMAYWINAYNTLVIEGIIEDWPVKSVRDMGLLPFSFFRKKRFRVGGREITLDNIEHDMLRKRYADPRIHFAINSASASCPLLRNTPYHAATLDAELDEAVRIFFADPVRGMKIDAAKDTVEFSGILKWYGEDFERYERGHGWKGAGSPLIAFAEKFSSDATRQALAALKNPQVKFLDYDWSVNSTPSK
jgi:hypothetical protein